MSRTVASFTEGFGQTAVSVGALIALGAMFGKLLADSGGADQIVDTTVARAEVRALPWAMALVRALVGLPMFMEIGVVLMPVIFLAARRSGRSIIEIGFPAPAGLSVMHGLVPPHPGPLVAIDALNADLGATLWLGVLIAVPVLALSGPLYARYAARWVSVAPRAPLTDTADEPGAPSTARARVRRRQGRGRARVGAAAPAELPGDPGDRAAPGPAARRPRGLMARRTADRWPGGLTSLVAQETASPGAPGLCGVRGGFVPGACGPDSRRPELHSGGLVTRGPAAS